MAKSKFEKSTATNPLTPFSEVISNPNLQTQFDNKFAQLEQLIDKKFEAMMETIMTVIGK